MTVHEMSPRMFASLARGGGGAEAAGVLVRSRRSRTLLLLRAVAELVVETGHPAAGATVAAYRGLRMVPSTALGEVLDYPRVGAWAMRTAALLDAGAAEAAAPGQLCSVLAAARVRAQLSGTVEVPGGTAVVLPSLGTFHGVDGTVRVVTGPRGSTASDRVVKSRVTGASTRHWHPLRKLRVTHSGLNLSLAVDGVHGVSLPPHVVAHDRLSAADEPRWTSMAGESWRLLVTHHREVAEEIAATLSVLTPLTTSLPGHSSLTFPDALGCVATSLPDDPRHLAVTLAHEVQHAKLSALMDLFPLVRADSSQRLRVAWRHDPRPPVAVLQGAYAHLAVAAFWRRHDDREARAEFTRWSSATLAAVDALSSAAVLTPAGSAFVTHMRDELHAWAKSGDQCQGMDKKLSK